MFRERLAETLGGVPDPERQDPTLADDLAGVYVCVKEGLVSIPEAHGTSVQVPRCPNRLQSCYFWYLEGWP